ncbi:hypothetical protein PWT90_06997 [Aphanocladium album]|nr:hypothetical protein PWT90_06997 [Aphanocladium album]
MFSNPQCLTWEEIICLFNLAKGGVSCVGFAKSPRRRCQRARNQNAVRLAYGILDNMAPLGYGIGTKTKQDLSEIAGLMLCYHHVDQAGHVAFSWTMTAEEEIAKLKKPPQYQCFERQTQGSSERQRINSWQRPHPQNEGPFKEAKFNTFGYASWTPKWPRAETFNSSFNSGGEPDYRATNDSSCHGPDQKPKNATPPPSQPKPAPKSAPKPPKPATTPTPKSAPTPTKKTDRQIWDETWDNYLASWVYLDKNPKELDLKVPWPTKTGQVADVTEENVRRFFWEGPSNGKKAGEEWFSSMRAETMRWHTDKIIARFAPGAVAQHKGTLDLIAQVVVVLFLDSKKNRHKS